MHLDRLHFALHALFGLLLSFPLSSAACAKGHKHHDSPPADNNPGGNTGAYEWVPPED